MRTSAYLPQEQGLYNPIHEHDACGVGMVVDTKAIASHSIVEKGITILERLLHRGATGSDPETGDGAGMLLQIPHDFFKHVVPFDLPEAGKYAVGMFFLPRQEELRKACCEHVAQAAQQEGVCLLGWRDVPVDDQAIGKTARECAPHIMQCFFAL